MRSTRILPAALAALLLSACGAADHPLESSAANGAPRFGIGMLGSGNVISTEPAPEDGGNMMGSGNVASLAVAEADSADVARGGTVMGSGNNLSAQPPAAYDGPNIMGSGNTAAQIGATSTTSVLPDSADSSRGGNVKGSGN